MAKRIRLKHHQLAAELAKSRYSQNRWAEVLGLGRGHLSLLVNGKRPYPSADTRRKLVEGLGVPFSTLFEIEDTPMPGSNRPRHLAWLPRAAGFAEEGIPMADPLRDFRYALRALSYRPLFTATIVLVLALGVGANTAMFSWVNAVLFDLLLVEQPDRYTQLYVTWPSFDRGSFSVPNFRDHQEGNDAFEDLFAFRFTPVSVAFDGNAERASGGIVSGNYFRALDAGVHVGRLFGDSEDEVIGRDPVAVISHSYWQRQLGGSEEVVGREFTLNGYPFTVVGVLPEGFGFARLEPAVDVYVPLSMIEQARPGSDPDSRGSGFLSVYGKLRAGVTVEAAAAAMAATHAGLVEEYPNALEDSGLRVVAAAQSSLGPNRSIVSGVFWVLMAMVGTVLLIACANVANLLMARAADRRREMGIRVAIGASGSQIARHLFAESTLLAAAGGMSGVLVAVAINRAIMGLKPALPIPINIQVALDGRALTFTLVATMLTGILFGLAPALRLARADVNSSLRGEDARVAGGSKLRTALVVTQVGLSLMLLIGAALFLRSLGNASAIDPGFDADNVLVASVDPGLQGYSIPESRAFFRELVDRVESLPGVQRASLAEMLPMALGSQQWGVNVVGYDPAPNERMNVDYNYVAPGYFESLDMAIIMGRDFTWQDTADAVGAIIVNETMAERFWPGESPVGRELWTADMDRVVVGVVSDAKYYSLGEDPLSYMYVPFLQSNQTGLALHVRTGGDPTSAVSAVRDEVRGLDSSLPIFDVRTLRAQLGIALLPARLAAGLLGVFGAFALLLAGVGIYGVMAHNVGRRTREIGIRMALGAAGGDLTRMVLRQATTMLAIGVVIGAAGGFVVGTVAQGLLYGVGSVDPLAFGGAVLVIAMAVLLAAFVPVRRAILIDPVEALRTE